MNARHIGGDQVGLLLYAVLNLIVDGYVPVLDAISEEIDTLEDRIFVRFDARPQQRVFELLSSALDSYLSMSSNRLNLVMRRLTASSIILMAMTLVAVGV